MPWRDFLFKLKVEKNVHFSVEWCSSLCSIASGCSCCGCSCCCFCSSSYILRVSYSSSWRCEISVMADEFLFSLLLIRFKRRERLDMDLVFVISLDRGLMVERGDSLRLSCASACVGNIPDSSESELVSTENLEELNLLLNSCWCVNTAWRGLTATGCWVITLIKISS